MPLANYFDEEFVEYMNKVEKLGYMPTIKKDFEESNWRQTKLTEFIK